MPNKLVGLNKELRVVGRSPQLRLEAILLPYLLLLLLLLSFREEEEEEEDTS